MIAQTRQIPDTDAVRARSQGVAMGTMLSIDDFRNAAQRRLPRLVFDYVDGAAETESTMRANQSAFREVTLRPRGGIDATTIDIGVSLLGHRLSMPLFLSPCGMSRVVNSGGDRAGAAAASAMGTLFVQSTITGHPVREVVEAANGGAVWYQAYQVGSKQDTIGAIGRARDAGAQALVVTIDSAVGSLRERDRRNGGMAILGQAKLAAAPHFFKLAGHPRWFADRIKDGLRPKLMNLLDENGQPTFLGRGGGPRGLGWHDLEWVRQVWPGPIVIKGVLTGDDAERAIAAGAAAIVISNHGGRQLDTADSTLSVLPEIADTVSGRCPVILDGGIRSGTDVLKALCLGADAVGVGRPWLFGLAAAGQSGVEQVLQILKDGITRNLGLLGVTKPSELDRSYVRAPQTWFEPQPGLASVRR